ncbi:hypothetical protein A3G67_03320 [Candidatus Roizmanbacteria bacterium RIFCSPLOWO2_12_FULL_40_12]|uniref:PDZ domain-containing protein n=1 Tax=Candidatus Roizmanbacteria bacterium RIFCSPLOWO2_01_FULL_40_42 TaxID=1802066 RepID=A0A1F7J5I0_9BACT|nr:MAG: hypothetical protein A2779_02955 [Candidatus Roizmanbacteria bacterium RIFCSPHIGHO2_01_FULL_40_98]OGK28301.1 MAG: hypothetical protein A3C31_00320 [Candidatus Roizmanbacteria bacterium RIFCSPHIGHO2_02_FULL_40_53]OGK30537.1 MAG: hypothetical protein A2W49_03005 [Candidatus Roizmanbacteria bacterium RIFCSPHIGHO2_12_41_18]OGK36951.1 MAG: hypothetical protein A3E69_00580 [Candidatus Roizmanbacteria bacterium RIFCSPHIGHO2_12_FULL_40_130]OGK50857.1 MAG: hypothetical protein A3B50_01090 [Candi
MNKGKVTNWLLVLSLAVLLFGSGFKLGEFKALENSRSGSSYSLRNATPPPNIKSKEVDFGLFWETWDKVEQKFIDKKKVDPQKMFYGAIKGLVSSLEDPYTFFLTPDENKDSKADLEGKFEGIGAQLGLKSGRVVVIAPLKNSPAVQAGIQAGDYIVKVDGQSTKNWTLPQTVSKIRGKKGTTVKLTLLRGEKEFDVTITREQILVDSIDLSFEGKKGCKSNCEQVAVLKINQFGENTNNEWDRAVDQVKLRWGEGKIKGLVVDLRDNPGGFLESSVHVASEFLPEGKLVVKQESSVSENREYVATRQGKLLDIPVVVIINKGSASASEILAGALRDQKRAQLVGEKSFGKGSVQEALDLSRGAGLHVTIAKWILPGGAWINGKGIEPETKVENKLKEGNTITREDDLQLETAIGKLIK